MNKTEIIPMPEVTTISIRQETRKKLMELGKKGETYDDVINRLISRLEELERTQAVFSHAW